MCKKIKIENKIISENTMPFIIAEAGVNYYEIAEKYKISLLASAKKMIEEAAKAGADAIKFQTYKADKLASKEAPAYWDTKKECVKSQYELFKKYDKFGKNEFKELAKYAKKKRIIFLSTPFDEEAVDFLDDLVPIFKISSSDITNIPFIRYVARKGKPIFLSTGASTIGEIDEAVNVIKNEGNNEIVIMHCILSYPTKYEDANLRMINYLNRVFPDNIIGYSDHTLPDSNMLVLITAFLLGARVIEKHFTLDKTLPGNDHYHAMDPADLKKTIEHMRLINKTLGRYKKIPIESESLARIYARRSIVAKINILEGTEISSDMVTCKRPGIGISPKYLDFVIGKKAKRNIKKDEIIKWSDII